MYHSVKRFVHLFVSILHICLAHCHFNNLILFGTSTIFFFLYCRCKFHLIVLFPAYILPFYVDRWQFFHRLCYFSLFSSKFKIFSKLELSFVVFLFQCYLPTILSLLAVLNIYYTLLSIHVFFFFATIMY